MKTITLIAKDRPIYTANALTGIADALIYLAENSCPTYDKLIVSLDPVQLPEGVKPHSETEIVCEKICQMLCESGLIECEIYTNKMQFGVGGNHSLALHRAFEEHRSDYNVLVEDDAVLSPDALLLANWFYSMHGFPQDKYTLLSLCNHRDFGPSQTAIASDPSYLAESLHITSPFACGFTKWQWPFIKASWNCKTKFPTGWDWSLSFAMRLERRRAIHPVLSRCQNIGRENGTNETPQTFDKTQLGLKYSDGSYQGDYLVVAQLDDMDLYKLDDWMISERKSM